MDMDTANSKQILADRAATYIGEHYTGKFSLDEIAGTLFVNKSYLARVFHDKTGMTLLEYHNRMRCQKACELLCDPSLSINIIAFRTGFTSSSHFSRIFKLYEGCTPSQYRKRLVR